MVPPYFLPPYFPCYLLFWTLNASGMISRGNNLDRIGSVFEIAGC
jgi:hypothetical protein